MGRTVFGNNAHGEDEDNYTSSTCIVLLFQSGRIRGVIEDSYRGVTPNRHF